MQDRPNRKWVTDISYIHTKQGVLYLSMISAISTTIALWLTKRNGTNSESGSGYHSSCYEASKKEGR